MVADLLFPRRGPTALTAALAAVVALLGLAPAAAIGGVRPTGAAVQQILGQCASGHLSGNFTVGQLQQALSVMPASASQYTSCPDVVQTAIVDSQRHRGAGPGAHSAGTFLPAPVIAILAVLVGGAAVLGVMAVRKR